MPSYRVFIGNNAGGSGTYELHNGSLEAGSLIVGSYGTGLFVQSGGTAAINGYLSLGDAAGGSGTYNLSGGSLSAFNQYVGNYGSGAFTQSGGDQYHQMPLAGLYVGWGGSGTYDLQQRQPCRRLPHGRLFRHRPFTQTGGTNAVSNSLSMGEDFTGSGIL